MRCEEGKINISFPRIYTRPNTTNALEITMKCYFFVVICSGTSSRASSLLREVEKKRTSTRFQCIARPFLFRCLYIYTAEIMFAFYIFSTCKYIHTHTHIIKRLHNKKKIWIWLFSLVCLFVVVTSLYWCHYSHIIVVCIKSFNACENVQKKSLARCDKWVNNNIIVFFCKNYYVLFYYVYETHCSGIDSYCQGFVFVSCFCN